MKYCVKHSSIAESEAGAIGGKAAAWNKGLTANTDNRIAKLAGESNPFWRKHHTEEAKNKISQSKRLSNDSLHDRVDKRSDEFHIATPLEDYKNRQKQYLDFVCTECGTANRKTLQAFERGSLCDTCHPITSSQPEIEIEKWLLSCGFVTKRSDRTVIPPKELDIIVPEKKIAIEYNGLYWHSELSKDSAFRSSHRDKTQECLRSGWQLVQVFSDDWQNKKEIVKSILLHKLGSYQEKFHARKCTIKELAPKDRKSFFEKNHISGDVSSKKAWALADVTGSVVAVLSVKSPIQKKWKDRIEIARFATKAGAHVPGALSKLLQHAEGFAKSEGKIGLISYADRRYGEGNCYKKVGFVLSGNTGLDYWYTDGTKRFDRFSFRAIGDLSERQRAEAEGVRKVWGCGSNIWLLDYTQ
jgi:G:T-mismatch repair DNA endonuclease (very short patch repair protein)/ribosomal protein L44E